MRVSRVSGVAVLALVGSLLAPITAATADPVTPPSAAITSPPAGTGVSGVITITATGQVDPAAMDSTVSLSLLVDTSTILGSAVDCTTQLDPNNCSATFSYDTTGLSVGTHTLQAELMTVAEGYVDSPAVSVVVPAPPSVSIDPVAGHLTGPVTVSVTGTTDAASTDTPSSVELDWGTTTIGTQSCPVPTQHSCPLSFAWDTTGINGKHDLTATMTTTDGAQATAVQSDVVADNPPPTATIDSPTAGAAEKGIVPVSAHGSVTGNQTEFAKKIDLFVNSGTTPVDTVACDTNSRDCSTSALSWDATGRADGTYTLKVVFTSTLGRTGSDSVQVHVTSPAPTVAITSPVDGDTVFGVDVQVHATGTVDASQTDTGASMDLYVDGVHQDQATCPVSSKSCPVVLHWDASGINGNRNLTVTFNTTKNKHVTSPATTVKVTTTPPSATISSPVNGATVTGVVSVATSGTVNPQQNDTPASMQLLVDGTAVSGPQPCTGTTSAPKACSLSYSWDTTGMSGQHTLQAKFLTNKGFSASSPVTTLTVVSPSPTATITSPVSLSTVHRTATITVTGAVDASQTDSPASIRLTLDGAALGGAMPCTPAPAAPRTCQVAYAWSTIGLTGRHTLVATVVSAKGVIGTSAATPVYVYGGTKTVIAPAKARVAGRLVTYTGRVTTLINRLGVPGVKVKVVIRPAAGRTKTVYVLTNVHGFFKVSFKPAVNTTVAATLVPLPYYGSSHSATKLHVLPRVSCTVGSTIRRSRLDHGSCTFPGLPKTTKVTLQYQFAGHWYTLGAGRAPGATIPFSFTFAVRGSYLVRLVLSATSVFAATTGPSLKVQVT